METLSRCSIVVALLLPVLHTVGTDPRESGVEGKGQWIFLGGGPGDGQVAKIGLILRQKMTYKGRRKWKSGVRSRLYGDLYQWGRLADGHQSRTSQTTETLSTSDTPGDGSFILVSNAPVDWRTPQNDNLWQGVTGINNPCPSGFRLPTEVEFVAEHNSWSSQNYTGAFTSPP